MVQTALGSAPMHGFANLHTATCIKVHQCPLVCTEMHSEVDVGVHWCTLVDVGVHW